MQTYLEMLETRRGKIRGDIDTYMRNAADRGEDLTDAENAAVEELDKQLRSLDERLKPLQDQAIRDGEHAARQAEVDRAIAGHTTPEEPADQLTATYRSAGDYLADWSRWKKDDDSQAKHRLYRAIQHQTTADNPGLLPVPILGPVSSILNRTRPGITSVGPRAMPAKGKTFQRPKVTQHTVASGQPGGEKTALNSQKMTITALTVTKVTYGGVVNISQQDIDWTEPSIWNVVLDDLFGVLAAQTEAAFASALVAAATVKTTLAAVTDPAVVITALYSGAATVYAATGQTPDTLWVSADIWAKLGSLSDTAKRPVFPYLGPVNAAGQMGIDSLAATPLGVRLVVSPALPANTMILGIASFAEWYETAPAQVSVSEPELLGVQLAVYAYAAPCFPQGGAFTYFAA